MFKEVDPKQSFPKLEEELVKHWKENKTFEKSVEKNKKDYVFYDGPPFATGLPHYGHLLAGTLKDVVPRYWTMQGYRIERKWGWDCHGLPIENLIEKELGLKNKKEIKKYGIDKFNEACRASVLKYAEEWKKTVSRMGRWVDMENDYKTMDVTFMESIWWVFKSLYEKGFVYEGKKAIQVCPRCETVLSNFEVGQGYKEIHDIAAIAKFKITDVAFLKKYGHGMPTSFIAWTTTPWSIPTTMGLAVSPEFDYVILKIGNEQIICARARVDYVTHTLEKGSWEVVRELKGKEIVGVSYEHPFADIYTQMDEVKKNPNVYKTHATDYVSVEDGTGIVTINGAFGEIDMEAAHKIGLPVIVNVAMDGAYTAEMGELAGQHVKPKEDTTRMDQKIAAILESKGALYRKEKVTHSYPHCWRCDSPLLNYATTSWFIATIKIRDLMLKSNQKIHWSPAHIKEGRFGKWIENVKDWSVSRGRYWGTPIPVWRNVENEKDVIVVGSIEELKKLSGVEVKDLHKHIVDPVEIKKNGKTYKRIEEVFDCWVESGSMPYGQMHYPFENKKKFEKNFPANFIAEGVDQTRCWFYVLHVLSNALFKKPAFQNVIVNGIVLAENGQKMSKRLKNYPDPNDVINKYGADSLRFYLLNSPVVAAGDLRFSEQGVEQVLRSMIIPLWNAYSFFVTYANIDGWMPAPEGVKTLSRLQGGHSKNKLDRWILAELNQLIAAQIEYFNVYDLQKASNSIYKFVDDLTNWYIRRSRRRFWKSEDDADKNHAYETLYTVLTRLCQVLAPFTPFVPEAIYRNLTGEESVHLTDYPKPTPLTSPLAKGGMKGGSAYDATLTREIHLAKSIVSLGLAARAKKKIKVRQPLQKIDVVLADPADHALLKDQLETIREELNVKEINFVNDASLFATRIARPDARLLGPKYGKDVQKIIQAAKAGQFEELGNGNILVGTRHGASEEKFELLPNEIAIDYVPKGSFDVECGEGILIALDTEITPELKREGLARDLIRQIQDLRKEAGYKVDDRIRLMIMGASPDLILQFGDAIQKETLATNISTQTMDCDKTAEYEGINLGVRK